MVEEAVRTGVGAIEDLMRLSIVQLELMPRNFATLVVIMVVSQFLMINGANESSTAP